MFIIHVVVLQMQIFKEEFLFNLPRCISLGSRRCYEEKTRGVKPGWMTEMFGANEGYRN